jgi:hypothetical protein
MEQEDYHLLGCFRMASRLLYLAVAEELIKKFDKGYQSISVRLYIT